MPWPSRHGNKQSYSSCVSRDKRDKETVQRLASDDEPPKYRRERRRASDYVQSSNNRSEDDSSNQQTREQGRCDKPPLRQLLRRLRQWSRAPYNASGARPIRSSGAGRISKSGISPICHGLARRGESFRSRAESRAASRARLFWQHRPCAGRKAKRRRPFRAQGTSETYILPRVCVSCERVAFWRRLNDCRSVGTGWLRMHWSCLCFGTLTDGMALAGVWSSHRAEDVAQRQSNGVLPKAP